jgi:myo-inositol-1(or 4)-monophosphatase
MSTTNPPISLEDMKVIALEAGVIMRQYFVADGMKRTVKEDFTPLTVADNLINTLVIDRVKNIDSTIDILGEEESSRTSSEWQITCDPIDGTFPFTWGIPLSTFMMSLQHKGKVITSVIYDPYMERMYHAEIGQGAFLNGSPIQVSKVNITNKPVIGYVALNNDFNMYAVCGELAKQGFNLINFFSIGYKEAKVATGEYAGTIFPQFIPNSFHDTAPGHLLVEEAGGIVTDLYGETQDYLREEFRGHIMANSIEIHQALLDAVKKFG